MKKLRKRVVFCSLLLLLVLSLGSCGKKEEKTETTDTEEYYTKRGFYRGTDGYYYTDSDPEAYYDDMLNRYEIGDTESGYDDILFKFIKSISSLDFKAAINFTETSDSSSIVNTFMEEVTSDDTSTYSDYGDGESVETDTMLFSRDLYKDFLLSIEVGSIQDTVYCEGYNIVTINIKHNDFTNLEFWKQDYDTIMEDLYDIYKNSNDYSDIELRTTDYIVKYIQDKYRNSDEIEKKESRVEFTLVQNTMGSWSVRSDEGLYDLAMKNNGRYIYEDISKSFEKYKSEREQEEYSSNYNER